MQQATVPLLVGLLSDALQTEQVIARVMEAQIRSTNVPELRMQMERHLQETRAQVDRLAQRLGEMGITQPVRGQAPAPFVAMLQAAEAGANLPPSADAQVHLLMQNTWSAFATEHYEIAMYRTLEALANNYGDEMTATLARQNRREEEMSARFLEGHTIDVANLVEAGDVSTATPGLTREAAIAGAAQIPGPVHDTGAMTAPPVASDVTHIGPAGGNEWNLRSSAIRSEWEQGNDPSTKYQWGEAEPYLRHGYEAAANGRYAGRRFEDVETELRTGFYATSAGSDVTPTYATPTVVVQGDSVIPDVFKGDVYVGDVYGDAVPTNPPTEPQPPRPVTPMDTPLPNAGLRDTGHSMGTTPESEAQFLAAQGTDRFQPGNLPTPEQALVAEQRQQQVAGVRAGRDPGAWETFRAEVKRGFESFGGAAKDTLDVTNEDKPQFREPRR